MKTKRESDYSRSLFFYGEEPSSSLTRRRLCSRTGTLKIVCCSLKLKKYLQYIHCIFIFLHKCLQSTYTEKQWQHTQKSIPKSTDRREDKNVISSPIPWEETKFLTSLLNSRREATLGRRAVLCPHLRSGFPLPCIWVLTVAVFFSLYILRYRPLALSPSLNPCEPEESGDSIWGGTWP